MTQRKGGRQPFNETTAVPNLQLFDQVRHLLQSLGTPEEEVLRLPPTVVGFIADHLQQIHGYKERIKQLQEQLQEAEFDVIRLRGQRNALRSALIKNHEQDPMLGYASDHMLEAITEVHRRPKDTAADGDDVDTERKGR